MNRAQGDSLNQQSESIASVLAAYAAAQAELDNVTQDREVEVKMKTGGKYKYRYATLAGMLNHLRPVLTKNGIWYTQFIRAGEMVTRVLHSSGEYFDTGNVPMPNITGSPQDIGAIVSFFKRYSLSEAFGLAADDDTDGDTGRHEVSFKARGERSEPTNETTERIEEPEMGWGDWARGLIATVNGKESDDELNELVEANKRFINSAKKVDKFMYDAIQKAFRDRRAVVNDNVAF